LVAEHGILGFFALLTLFAMAWRCFRRSTTINNRVLAVSLVSWSFLFMMAAAMRTAGPGLVFGLAFLAYRAYVPGGPGITATARPWLKDRQIENVGAS
jgi:hypothetical protein